MAEEIGVISYEVRAETAQAIQSTKFMWAELDKLEGAAVNADGSVRKLNTTMTRAASGVRQAASEMKGMNGGIQQAGFQIQDFIVQLQGGTSAFVAFGQQGSQLAGAFGAGGAVAGAVIALASVIGQLAWAARNAAQDLEELAAAGDRVASLRLNTLVKINDASREFTSNDRLSKYKKLGGEILNLTTTYENQQLATKRLKEEAQSAQDALSDAGGFFGDSQAEATAKLTAANARLSKSLEEEAAIRSKVNGIQSQMNDLSQEESKLKSDAESKTKKYGDQQDRINQIIESARLRTAQLTDQYSALSSGEEKVTSTKLRHTEASARLEAQQRLTSAASSEQIDALAKEIYAQDQMAAKLDARIERQKRLDKALKDSLEQAKKDGELQGKFDPVEGSKNKYAEESAMLLEARQKDLITEQTFQMQKAALANQYEQQRLAAAEELYRAQSDGNAFIMDSVNALGQASTSTISGLLSGTMSATEAMQNFANIILNQAVGALVGMGIEYVKQQLLQQTMAASASAAQVAIAATTGSAMAAAYAPAAAMASLASFGANAAPAQAGIASTVAMSSGLALAGGRQFGGPVNPGSMYRVGEGNAPELLSVGGSNYMIPGSRGQVTPMDGAGSGVTFNITNQASDMVQTQQSYDPETRTVELAITAVANQMNTRTGKIGAAMKSAGAYSRLG